MSDETDGMMSLMRKEKDRLENRGRGGGGGICCIGTEKVDRGNE